MPAQAFSIDARPERVLRDSGGKVSTSIEQIEQTQKAAIAKLKDRLSKLYEQTHRHYAADRFNEADRASAADFDAANQAIWEIFEPYSKQRGPLLSSLALIAGWPDRNPNSKGDPEKMRLIQKNNFEKAKKLRAEVAALDGQFAQDVIEYLSVAQNLSRKRLTEARKLVNDFVIQLSKRADAESKSQIRATPKELDIRLANARTTVLPAVPAQTVEIPAGNPMPPAPRVTFRGIGNGTEEKRRLVEQELQIWLGLHRFKLAKHGQGVPDETDEFKAWRKTLLSAGP
jgi:hypothetical protein